MYTPPHLDQPARPRPPSDTRVPLIDTGDELPLDDCTRKVKGTDVIDELDVLVALLTSGSRRGEGRERRTIGISLPVVAILPRALLKVPTTSVGQDGEEPDGVEVGDGRRKAGAKTPGERLDPTAREGKKEV
jgi:hypothetical protein